MAVEISPSCSSGPQRSILFHSHPILRQIFIPRIILAGLTSAESPRTSHTGSTRSCYSLRKTPAAVQHIIPALDTLSYFEPVIRSRAEAGRNVDNKLYAEADNVPRPPCGPGLKSLEMGAGILVALVGKTESSSPFHKWKQSI